MKHRLAIPFLEACDPAVPDIGGWAHRFGWRIARFETIGAGVIRYGGETQWLRVTLAPWASRYGPIGTGEITVTSGATLIYDDADRSMAVTLEPEPEDARPVEPRDAVPAQARR